MDIIIGRERESSRLHLVGSGNKEKFIGYPGSVPRSVSRTHCKLTIDGTVRIALYAVALLLGVYFFFGSYRSSSETPKFLDDLDRQFHNDYVCPNPDCHHFMGYQQYRELKKNGTCPYCRSRFTEEE